MPEGYYKRPTDRPRIINVVGPSIAYVPLTRGLFAVVDSEDVSLIVKHPWRIALHGEAAYARTTIREEGVKKTFEMQALLTCYPKPLLCDHVNRNTLDNRRCNLRSATRSQNTLNSGRRVDNTSGYKGVCQKSPGVWHSSIRVNGKRIHLGSFRDPALAHAAYVDAAKKYAGEFSNGGVR